METMNSTVDTHTHRASISNGINEYVYSTHIRTVGPMNQNERRSCKLQSARSSPEISPTHTQAAPNTILNKNQLEAFRFIHYSLSNNQLIQAYAYQMHWIE